MLCDSDSICVCTGVSEGRITNPAIDEGREHREERHLDRRSKCEILSTMMGIFHGDAADAVALECSCLFALNVLVFLSPHALDSICPELGS